MSDPSLTNSFYSITLVSVFKKKCFETVKTKMWEIVSKLQSDLHKNRGRKKCSILL
jgi:hypothetical protein